MSETARDKAWIAVIGRLADYQPIQVSDVASDAGVHDETARIVLRVAEDYDLLERENEQGHTYYPCVEIGYVSDPEVRGAIRALVAQHRLEG